MTLRDLTEEDNELIEEEDSNEDVSDSDQSEESVEEQDSDDAGGLFVEGYDGEEQLQKARNKSTIKKKKQNESVNLPKYGCIFDYTPEKP